MNEEEIIDDGLVDLGNGSYEVLEGEEDDN